MFHKIFSFGSKFLTAFERHPKQMIFLEFYITFRFDLPLEMPKTVFGKQNKRQGERKSINPSLVSFHIFDFLLFPYVHFYSILDKLFLSKIVSILCNLSAEFWMFYHFACFQIRHIWIRLKCNNNSGLISSHYNEVKLNTRL